MGISLILAGLLFLVVPTVNIVDVMPDFIGYFLIFGGLSKLKHIDSYMKKASGLAMIMAIVNLTKPVAFIVCTMGEGDASASNITTATLIYLVIELIYGINFIRTLFAGFLNLGYQFENGSVEKQKLVGRFLFKRKRLSREHSVMNPQSAEHKRTVGKSGGLKAVVYVSLPKRKAIFAGVDALSVFTVVFFTVRCIFTLVPELSTLAYTLTVSGTYEQVNNTALRLILMAFCVVAGLLLGIAWYVSVRKYLRGVCKDTAFIEKLSDAYRTRVTENSYVMRSIRYSGFEKIAYPAILLGGDLFIDRADLIPDLIPAVLFIFALFMMRKSLFSQKLSFTLLGVYCAVSTAGAVCQYLSLGSHYADTGAEMPFAASLFGVLFPVMKGLFTLILLVFLNSQHRYIDLNFQRAPIYSKGRLTVGTILMIAAQIGSAVGYYTDIISDDLMHFPVKMGDFVWDANVYVSFGSFVVYLVGAVVLLGGIDHVSARLAGKE